MMKSLDRPETILKNIFQNIFQANFNKNEDAMLLHYPKCKDLDS